LVGVANIATLNKTMVLKDCKRSRAASFSPRVWRSVTS